MAAASTEPHPSSPARLPSLSPAPKLLPRDKQTRRQGRLPRLLPPPRSPPFPAPGPSGLRLPSCDSSPSPSQRGRVRAAAAWARKVLPPSLTGHFRAGRDPPPGFGSRRRSRYCRGLRQAVGPRLCAPAALGTRSSQVVLRDLPSTSVKLSLPKKSADNVS